ncbi:threonylcarbamoyl-AMP synthase [Microaerobacter geothermalis]|uniref:L-threonylcarbamoyladenylate synthase n=1 Tax=Microaerobacter geothermalis TaxID=674972 RepID=UPI001F3D0EB3|nr:L-threonylcarbamoyladenylate synthase [Microaerobacter geothermalis]MCF6093201.1 threonylcarbamoyl-AMP synthase [Microaerobacter geothermalis]
MVKLDTKVWIVDKDVDKSIGYPQIKEAAEYLRKNEVVAFPTETVYGLGGNAMSPLAVQKIFTAKGRPGDNPLIVHIAERDQVREIVSSIPDQAISLMEEFWPGPLTLLFPKGKQVPDQVTAGLDTVAVRMPDHPVALALLKESRLPIAAPSANRSGRPSPTTAQHVWEDLHGRIAGIVDGGPTQVGVESTVLDVSAPIPTILRPGGITIEELRMRLGEVQLHMSLVDEKVPPKSPGMKYTHYAPRGELWLVAGDEEQMVRTIQRLAKEAMEKGEKVGILSSDEHKEMYRGDVVISIGSRHDPTKMAANVYQALREFDHQQVTYILSETFSPEGIGLALMNRLHKAAGGKIIK